jgi:predicted extracellular nuclease
MKKLLHPIIVFALVLVALAGSVPLPAQAVSPNIVISQVYGGGGNQNAPYKNDFVELFNRGTTPVSLNGWSIQYTSATGAGNFGASSTLITELPNVSLAPGQYFLVQEAAGNSCSSLPCGVDLPVTPDFIDATPINISGTGGKVALVNTTAPLGCNGVANTCTPAALATIVDLVGWDGANFYETTGVAGTGPASATTNPTAIFRNNGGCTETDNNSADFGPAAAPAPRNTASPKYFCTADAAPFVQNTVPANGAVDVPLNSNITINFSEPVNTTGQWFSLVCATSGDHTANVNVTGGPTSFSLDPGTDFVGGELCTLTVFAANVNDQDLIDPPDNMVMNFTAGFTTVTPPIAIGTVNGPVPNSDYCATHVSPYVGQTVTVQGVIYEKTLQAISNSTNTYKGFYIQNTSATADTDPNTSDGIFVFMATVSTIGTYTPQVGDEIILSSKVSEYYNMTELVSPLTVKAILRNGVDINTQVAPVVANPPVSLADANCYWERLQGMRVQVPQNSIVLGGRNVFSPADAEIWVANPDSTVAKRTDLYTNRAFRDAHPLDDNYDAANWDGNGYRILMGSLGIKATVGDVQALIAPARTFSTLTNAPVGGLNYTFSKYRIEVDAQPTFSEGVDPAANNPPSVFDRSIHYTIADYNLENLYDYRDNPFSGCDFTGNSGCPKVDPFLSAVTPPYDYVPASDAAYQARLNDIALQIVNALHSPDILMVQEVENQDICTVTGGALTCGAVDNADGKPDVLQELDLKITANGGPAYNAAFDRNSSDLRGIAPAFLYRTDRVQLLSPVGDPILGTDPAIAYAGATVPANSDVSNPKTFNAVLPVGFTGACETSWVFPRAPGVALFRIYSTGIGVGSYRDVYVIDNHFKSGPDTCVAHRTEQAKYNAAIVAFLQAANPNARIVLGGDLNVYPRPDDIGYGASDQLGSLYASSLGLTNLWEVLVGQAPESAYSYVYLGMAQTLDQMFVNQPMLADLKQFRIAHINSDFPADYPDDVARGTSDHDPNVAAFVINDPPTVDAGGPYNVNEGGSVALTATGTDPEGQPLTYAWDLDNNGTFETSGQSVAFAGVDGLATLTVKVQVTDNGGLTAVAEATVTVNNVAPTATFNAPASVNEGSNILLSLTNPVDVPADLGSLQYAFNCGSGYGTFGSSNSASCPTNDNGTRSVGGKVMDKDGGVNEYNAVVSINNVAPTVNTPSVTPEPSTEGSSVVASATFSDPGINDAPFTCIVNYGDGSGNLPGTVSGNTCTGPAHTYPTFGSYTVVVNVTDKDGGTGSNSTTHVVIFNWAGFFQPVDNLPTLNVVKAGSAIPVKFSLGGNKGLSIFATGYPLSTKIACDSGAPADDIEQTVTAGGSSLSYSAGNDQYNYVWKTEKSWAGTCRQLVVMLVDGTSHKANFKFK